MSCCSGRREALSRPPTFRAAPAVPLPASTGAQDLTLHYIGRTDLALRGPSSGRIYHVGPEARRIHADTRDVAALLRTGLFSAA